VSFDIPEYTSDITGIGTIRILEAVREAGLRSRFYQASSSEMFGKAQQVPQTEKTPFWPRSPYGVAKVFAYWATVNFRKFLSLSATPAGLIGSERRCIRRLASSVAVRAGIPNARKAEPNRTSPIRMLLRYLTRRSF
jgi:GDP-mannose 4,6-dehydratase